MLTDSEAAVLASQGAVAAGAASGQPGPAYTRIGAVLVALSLVAAIGLLHAAFFSDRGKVVRAPHAASVATIAIPIIQPMASGFPEGALFMRHRTLESE
jgi:hypothetical protein